ncbi:MAG: HU family DNA-binding protein [Bacilli bacterium]
MNKQELVLSLSEKLDVTGKEAGRVLDAVIDVIIEALKEGDAVKLAGFGTFAVKERAAREGVAPGTKNKIHIPARKAIGFKAAKSLKEEI